MAGAGVAYAFGHLGDGRPNYVTAPVEYGSVQTVVTATGTVQAEHTVEVSSQLSGQVAEVFVDFNDAVKAGQPLAQLEKETFVARVDEASAALKMASAAARIQTATLERTKLLIANARTDQTLAEALAASAQAKRDESEREFNRKSRLALTGSASDRDLSLAQTARETAAADLRAALVQVKLKEEAIELAKADLRIADATLENAEAVVEQKQASLNQAKLDLDRTVLRSPIDGVILDRAVDPGQTIAVSLDARTLFTIANNLDSMEVRGRIDEADVGSLQEGQTVKFSVDAYPDRIFTGKILQIRKASEVTQNVVTYAAIVSAPNPDHLLLPNMTAELSIVVADSGPTLQIPNQALRFQPGPIIATDVSASQSALSGTVWIVGDDGNPKPISVRLGESNDTTTRLVDGPLTEGQLLIIGVAEKQHWASGIRLGL
jgi:HlyD family secretion protein